MLTLEQAAYRVADNAPEEEREVFVDPMTIMLICSILSTLFAAMRVWCEYRRGQEKPDGEGIQNECKRPSLLTRMRVSRIVRRKLGREKYRQIGAQVCEAIFQAGASASPAEIAEIVERYSNDNGSEEVEL